MRQKTKTVDDESFQYEFKNLDSIKFGIFKSIIYYHSALISQGRNRF